MSEPIICPLCREKRTSEEAIKNHFTTIHGIPSEVFDEIDAEILAAAFELVIFHTELTKRALAAFGTWLTEYIEELARSIEEFYQLSRLKEIE